MFLMKIYETGIFYPNSLQVTTVGAHDKVVAYRRGRLREVVAMSRCCIFSQRS